jgi:undecaprenyl-diphosphatase
LKVDHSILALGGFYVVVMAVYFLFEVLAINYRPVLIEGVLEASYPSSTTLLVLCVLLTAMMQFHDRIKNRILRGGVLTVLLGLLFFMLIGHVLSGVHWITDIIGGAFLSAGLVRLYDCIVQSLENKKDI